MFRTNVRTADSSRRPNLVKLDRSLRPACRSKITTHRPESVDMGSETICEAGAGVREVPQIVARARRPVWDASIRREGRPMRDRRPLQSAGTQAISVAKGATKRYTAAFTRQAMRIRPRQALAAQRDKPLSRVKVLEAVRNLASTTARFQAPTTQLG